VLIGKVQPVKRIIEMREEESQQLITSANF
jgi:hypothetical protein